MARQHRPEFATKRTQIDDDRELLAKLIAHPAMALSSNLPRFVDMHEKLKRFIGLSDRQRAWVQHEAAAIGIPVSKAEHPATTPKHSAWDPELAASGKARTQRARLNRAVKALEKAEAKTQTRRRKGTTKR